MGTSKKQKKRDGLRYREFVLSPYGVIKIKSLGYTNTRLLLVGMILAAILVSVIVAAAITRSVTHPLNDAFSIA